MNERIKQLASESNLMEFVDGLEPIIYAHDIKRVEKFAELIVKECIEQAELEEDRFTGLDAMDLAYAMQNFQNLLKHHFGIE